MFGEFRAWTDGFELNEGGDTTIVVVVVVVGLD